MLLVMAGHAMELAGAHHLILWIGSGFRMPLMLGISGYLLNVGRLRSSGLRELLNRYGRRLLVPWAIAAISYSVVSGSQFSLGLFVELMLRPPFHLWYVPVLFFLILATWALRMPPLLLLTLGTPLSLTIMYAFGLNHGPIFDGLLAPDSRFLRYPVYFFFGMFVSQCVVPQRFFAVPLLLAGSGMAWWANLYGTGMELAYVPARLLMCLGLIGVLPITGLARLELPAINVIGHNSLFFYLWHPLAMGLIILTGVGPIATLTSSLLILAAIGCFAARYGAAAQMLGINAFRQPALQQSTPPTLAI